MELIDDPSRDDSKGVVPHDTSLEPPWFTMETIGFVARNYGGEKNMNLRISEV